MFAKKEIFEKEINIKGGVLISEFVNTGKKVKVKCKNSHEFEINYLDLIINKKWCENCLVMDENKKDEISIIIESLGYKYELFPKNDRELKFNYLIYDEDKKIYLDIDNLEEIGSEEYLHDLLKKFNFTKNHKLIKLVKENIDNEEIEFFLMNSILESEKFVYSHEKYNEIINIMPSFIEKLKKQKINEIKIKEDKNSEGYYFAYIDSLNSEKFVSEEDQKKEIELFCKNNGIKLEKIYIENHIASIKDRRVFKKMLKNIRHNDNVILLSMKILSGKLEEQKWVLNEIEDTKKSKLIIIHNYKVEERNFNTLSEKISFTLNEKSSKKILKTKARYGYKSLGRRKPFIEDEREQFIIERIRQLRKELPMPTLTMIAKSLESENLEYKPGKKWHLQRLSTIMEQNNIEKCVSFNYEERI